MSNLKDLLEKVYSAKLWPGDPEDPDAISRFKRYHDVFKELLERSSELHSLINSKELLKIVDLCAGSGLAGISFSNVVSKLFNKKITLKLIDLRENSLKKYVGWEKEENVYVQYEVKNVIRDSLGSNYDIALLFGLSTPHFSPLEMLKLLANVSKALCDNGIVIIEEVDRIYNIFYKIGYKDLLVQSSTSDVVLSLHLNYDKRSGVFIRKFLRIYPTYEPLGDLPVFMWSTALTSSYVWMFFKNVEIVTISNVDYIVASKPCRSIDIERILSSSPIFKE